MSDHYLNQPRDEDGKWVSEGGAMVSTIKDAGSAIKAAASDFGIEQEKYFQKIKDDAKELREKAKKALPEIQALAMDIAQRNNAVVTDNENLIKSEGSIFRKARDKYDGDVNRITDAARTTIIAEDGKTVDAIVNELSKNNKVIEVDIKTPDNDPLGYKGALLKYRARNGLIGEIQVNTAKMIYGKEPEEIAKGVLGETTYNNLKNSVPVPGGEGHKFYEKYREIDKFEPSNNFIIEDIIGKSRNYYKYFYD